MRNDRTTYSRMRSGLLRVSSIDLLCGGQRVGEVPRKALG